MTTTIPLKTELVHGLKDLHLPTMRACYQEMADQAQQLENINNQIRSLGW